MSLWGIPRRSTVASASLDIYPETRDSGHLSQSFLATLNSFRARNFTDLVIVGVCGKLRRESEGKVAEGVRVRLVLQ